MKYLITEKQLKTLRKYMKTFINEDSYNQDEPSLDQDETFEEKKDFSITNGGKIIADVEFVKFGGFEVYFSRDFNADEDIKDGIEDKLLEIYDENKLVNLYNKKIEYKNLMSM
jgi:hypothetical protein